MDVTADVLALTDHLCPAWAEAWSAGELSLASQRTFASSLAEHTPSALPIPRLSGAAAPRPLATRAPEDGLQHALSLRRSTRLFGAQSVRGAAFERLAWAVVESPGGALPYASAGALRPVHVVAALLRVDHPLGGRVLALEAATRSLVDLGPCPAWSELAEPAGVFDPSTNPALVVCAVCDIGSMADKYGERGGRFALLEAGHVVQNIVLRAAADDLCAYEVGGAADRALLGLLGLDARRFDLAAVVMIGMPPVAERARPARRRWRGRS